METLETLDFVLLFFGAIAAGCFVFGALGLAFAWLTTQRRQAFPAPYREIAAPVRRHRRPPEWPERLLEGWREMAAAHAVLTGATA